MADKKYIVLTRIKVGSDKKGTPQIVPEGTAVVLDDDTAAPLLACGAVRLSDENPEPAAAE